ncbi:hypothetical protein B1P92_03910 [Enterococcus faecium]|nr:hypothetical protein B1P92_03910 [Enterococcus faecium]
MLTDVFSMPSDLVLSDICLDDILQMAYNKSAYEGWKNYAINLSFGMELQALLALK